MYVEIPTTGYLKKVRKNSADLDLTTPEQSGHDLLCLLSVHIIEP